MNNIPLLMKREYWEHRGGFQWAPLIAAGVVLLVFTIATITGLSNLHIDGKLVSGVRLDDLAAAMTPEQRLQIGAGLDVGLFFSAAPIAITLDADFALPTASQNAIS